MDKIKITNHDDIRCAKVAWLLNNYDDWGGVEAIIELLRSDVPIDRLTREAMADAFERDLLKKGGIRLRLVKADQHPKTGVMRMEREYELQCIADEVKQLQQEYAEKRGLPTGRCAKEAKAEVMKRRTIGKDKVKDAMAYSRRARYRISEYTAE